MVHLDDPPCRHCRHHLRQSLGAADSFFCFYFAKKCCVHTVDGPNPALARIFDYPIIYRFLTIPGGAGFLPSTVGTCFFKQW